MLFDSDSREAIKAFGNISGRGGWLSLGGGLAVPVRVPHIGDMNKLNDVIRKNLDCV